MFEVTDPKRVLMEARRFVVDAELLGRIRAIVTDSAGSTSEATFVTGVGRRISITYRKGAQGHRIRRPRVGDLYAIPLPDSRFGHAHYVLRHKEAGDLVQVLAVVSKSPAGIPTLAKAQPLFPPIRTSVDACIRAGGWGLIGRLPVPSPFPLPRFRNSITAFLRHEPGRYADWYVWPFGGDPLFVGLLPESLRGLEFDVCLAPGDIADRIATGLTVFDMFV
jgi:hypothetical protein